MKIRAQAGAKVFFFGEYAALMGGPSVVLSIAPPYLFGVEYKLQSDLQIQGLPLESPTSLYLKQRISDGDLPPGEYKFSILEDSFELRGFGSSGVEFLSALAIENELTVKKTMNDSGLKSSFAGVIEKKRKGLVISPSTLETYRKLAGGKNFSPSGYDLLAQNGGNVQAIRNFQVAPEKTREFEALFASHLIGVFHTGRKIATHDAIRDLDESSLEKIKTRSEKVWQSSENPSDFWMAMRDFVSELQTCGWTQPESIVVLQMLRQDPRVLFAKACGAMGADSILIVLKSEEKSSLVFYDFEEFGLKFVGSNEKLSPPFFYERLL